MSEAHYEGDGYSAVSIEVIETGALVHPVGFIVLKERSGRPRVRVACRSRKVASHKEETSQ